jgi:hypothetical protein
MVTFWVSVIFLPTGSPSTLASALPKLSDHEGLPDFWQGGG